MMNPDDEQNINKSFSNPALIKPPSKINLTSGLTGDIAKSFNVPLLVNPTPIQPQNQTPNLTPNPVSSKTPDRNSPLPGSNVNPSIRPPLSIPPTLATTSATISNPYSAKGALNKKVYETVASAPLNHQTAVFDTISNVSNNENLGSLYVPPVANDYIQNEPPIQQEIQRFTPIVNTESQQIPQNSQFQMSSSINFQNDPYPMTQNQESERQQKKPWSWLTQNKIVDKLKSGVETVISTIDPQMKNYMDATAKHLTILNTSSDRLVNDSIREAFNSLGFYKLTIHHYEAQQLSNYAPQIVGIQTAVQAAHEKLNFLEQNLQNQQQSYIIIVFQDFLIELLQNNWYDQTCVLLKDTETQIELNIFTEAIQVPNDLITRVNQSTPVEYPLRWSGFAYRLWDNNQEWHEAMYGLSKRVLYSNSLKAILHIYKSKLMNFN